MKESNGLENIISQALEEMKTEQGNAFSLECSITIDVRLMGIEKDD